MTSALYEALSDLATSSDGKILYTLKRPITANPQKASPKVV
jgi:hypothetical protein